jgi:hypothetical protein
MNYFVVTRHFVVKAAAGLHKFRKNVGKGKAIPLQAWTGP